LKLGWVVVFLLASPLAEAHQSSIVYLDLSGRGRTVTATLQISNGDLYEVIGVARDRPVKRVEVERAKDQLLQYLASRLHVDNQGSLCGPVPRGLEYRDKSDGFFAVARIDYLCRRTLGDVRFRYDLFFDLDPRHQALGRVRLGDGPAKEHVFRSGARELHLDRPVTLFDHVVDYLLLGIEHIFTGYDHLAFLFGLLLVSSARGLRGGARDIFGIVTAFTIAHSLTLIAAGLSLVQLPSSFVEPAIAATIFYVALENLLIAAPRYRWLLTFGFGLLHGFGFASVLSEIGLPKSALVLSLVSFNIGVELGQLSVVAVAAPLLLYLVPNWGLSAKVRRDGSLLLLLFALFWFAERVMRRVFLHGWLG
jgi:hypothetical protein